MTVYDNKAYTFALVLKPEDAGDAAIEPPERMDFDALLRFPRVTTILEHVLAKPALAQWAYYKTLEGVDILQDHGFLDPDDDLDALLAQNRLRPNDIKEERADQGTATHAYLQALVTGATTVQVDTGHEAGVSKWWRTSGCIPVHSEKVVVSLAHLYAGRFDLLNSRLDWRGTGITDLKTRKVKERKSDKRIYGSDKAQIGAYRVAWNEMFPEARVTWGSVLVAMPDGTFDEEIVGPEWDEIFIRIREIYRLMGEPT